jgi:hypothetical protein
MFRTLRAAFGDASDTALVAAAKDTLRSPNAPLQEQAAALERLSSERDTESKTLVLAIATNSGVHEWLQQVAGEAVAGMLENQAILPKEARFLTSTAAEVAANALDGSEQECLRLLAHELRASSPAPVRTPSPPSAGEA